MTLLPPSVLAEHKDSEQEASLVTGENCRDISPAGFQVAWESPASAQAQGALFGGAGGAPRPARSDLSAALSQVG